MFVNTCDKNLCFAICIMTRVETEYDSKRVTKKWTCSPAERYETRVYLPSNTKMTHRGDDK